MERLSSNNSKRASKIMMSAMIRPSLIGDDRGFRGWAWNMYEALVRVRIEDIDIVSIYIKCPRISISTDRKCKPSKRLLLTGANYHSTILNNGSPVVRMREA